MSMTTMPGSLVQPGSDSLHPEAQPQTYLSASLGELSSGASMAELGYDAGQAGQVTHATGATAGTTGTTWTPASSDPPNTVADLIAGKPNVVTASPATAWTTGQYVQTGTKGTAGQAHWSGTAWVAGKA